MLHKLLTGILIQDGPITSTAFITLKTISLEILTVKFPKHSNRAITNTIQYKHVQYSTKMPSVNNPH